MGPKLAQKILRAGNFEMMQKKLLDGDIEGLTAIAGVGKKTAQKIILDLKSKVGRGEINLKNLEGSSEIIDSLISLGFQKQEIAPIMGEIDNSLPLESQIKSALKLLHK